MLSLSKKEKEQRSLIDNNKEATINESSLEHRIQMKLGKMDNTNTKYFSSKCSLNDNNNVNGNSIDHSCDKGRNNNVSATKEKDDENSLEHRIQMKLEKMDNSNTKYFSSSYSLNNDNVNAERQSNNVSVAAATTTTTKAKAKANGYDVSIVIDDNKNDTANTSSSCSRRDSKIQEKIDEMTNTKYYHRNNNNNNNENAITSEKINMVFLMKSTKNKTTTDKYVEESSMSTKNFNTTSSSEDSTSCSIKSRPSSSLLEEKTMVVTNRRQHCQQHRHQQQHQQPLHVEQQRDKNSSYNHDCSKANTKYYRRGPIPLVEHIDGPHFDNDIEDQQCQRTLSLSSSVGSSTRVDGSSTKMMLPIPAEVVIDKENNNDELLLDQLEAQQHEEAPEEKILQDIIHDQPQAKITSTSSRFDNKHKHDKDVDVCGVLTATRRRRLFLLGVLFFGTIISIVVIILVIGLGGSNNDEGNNQDIMEPNVTTQINNSNARCFPNCGLLDSFPVFASLSFSLDGSGDFKNNSWVMVLCNNNTDNSDGVYYNDDDVLLTYDNCTGLKQVSSFRSHTTGNTFTASSKQAMTFSTIAASGSTHTNINFRNLFLSVDHNPWDDQEKCTGMYEVVLNNESALEKNGISSSGTNKYTNGTLLCNNGDIIAYIGINSEDGDKKSSSSDNITYYLYYSTNVSYTTNDSPYPNYELNERSSFAPLASYFEKKTGEYCMDLFSLLSKLLDDLDTSSSLKPLISEKELSCGRSVEPSYVYYPAVAGVHFTLGQCTLHDSWLIGLCGPGAVFDECSFILSLTMFGNEDGSCTTRDFSTSTIFFETTDTDYGDIIWYDNIDFDSTSLNVDNSNGSICTGNYQWLFHSTINDYIGFFEDGRLLCNNGDIIAYLAKTNQSTSNTTGSSDEYYLYYSTRTENIEVNDITSYQRLQYYFNYVDGEYCLNIWHLMSKLLVDLEDASARSFLDELPCGLANSGI